MTFFIGGNLHKAPDLRETRDCGILAPLKPTRWSPPEHGGANGPLNRSTPEHPFGTPVRVHP